MRLVLDANQLVAALVRPPELATFLMSWESARFTVVASPELLEEYLYVLDYPEVSRLIYPELRRTFQGHLLQDIELIEPLDTPRLCRDPDDDKVIAAAVYGFVNCVVTVDKDLMTENVQAYLAEFGIGIATADEILRLLDTEGRAA